MTTHTQPFRLTHDEWLALPLEDQLGVPIDDPRTTPKNYACHAHYRLDCMTIQLTEVEVDVGVEEVVIRLAFADTGLDAPSVIAGLTQDWSGGWTETPIAKHLLFEVMQPN